MQKRPIKRITGGAVQYDGAGVKLVRVIGYNDTKDPLVEALKHEEYVTASINNIYEVAVKQKDYRSQQFLDWFIKEQGEEEANAQENIQKFEVFGSDNRGLYMLNKELETRVFSPPSLQL